MSSSRGDMHTKVTTGSNHGESHRLNHHTEFQSSQFVKAEKRDKMSINSVIKQVKEINTRAQDDLEITQQSIININRRLERRTKRVREGNKLITDLVLSLPPLDDLW